MHSRLPSSSCRRPGFSLVELLTVIFIITLLVAILVPAVNSARTAAKGVKTKALLRGISTGLEAFKADHEGDFVATNGYPPSFAHPKIKGYTFDPDDGEFPFNPSPNPPNPVVSGAHWLAAMLVGIDRLGYVPRSNVPQDQLAFPQQWYDNQINTTPIPRSPLYVEVDEKTIKTTSQIPGRPNNSSIDYFDMNQIGDLPLFVDAFDQPVLYYAANKFGRLDNMLADDHDPATWTSGRPPVYFHEDNHGWTGEDFDDGWNFGGLPAPTAENPLHWIAVPGDELTPVDLAENPTTATQRTFAYYILDRQALEAQQTITVNTSMRPVNHDTFLLITAGPDGRFGTPDDITNMPERD